MVAAMRVLLLSATLLPAVLGALGCEKRKSGVEPPVAQDWQGELAPPGPTDDPHAGVMDRRGGAADPHAGLDMGAMGGGMGGADPHAGVDMSGGDMHATGEVAVDPATAVSGAVAIAPALQAKLPATGVVFMSIRPAGADGQPAGMPLAVEVFEQPALPLTFTLSGGNQMVEGGGALSGEVVVMARWDQDGDAGTKQPGDITGMTRARVPASGLSITLDTVLP
jgi:hypothetical protein